MAYLTYLGIDDPAWAWRDEHSEGNLHSADRNGGPKGEKKRSHRIPQTSHSVDNNRMAKVNPHELSLSATLLIS